MTAYSQRMHAGPTIPAVSSQVTGAHAVGPARAGADLLGGSSFSIAAGFGFGGKFELGAIPG